MEKIKESKIEIDPLNNRKAYSATTEKGQCVYFILNGTAAEFYTKSRLDEMVNSFVLNKDKLNTSN